MTGTLTINAVPAPEDIIQFADSHRVSLAAGDYHLAVKQSLLSSQVGKGFDEEWTAGQRFSVRAERFQLAPSAIRSVFPPAGNRGNYWHSLPHIVLERSTLPWERTAEADAKADPATYAPWLALLVFHPEDPPPKVRTASWSNVRDTMGLTVEKSEQVTDQTKVIEVDTGLATLLIPPPEELPQLTHIRRRLARVGKEKSFKSHGEAAAFIRELLPDVGEAILESATLPAGFSSGWLYSAHDSPAAYEVLQKGQQFQCFHVAHEAATILARRLPRPGARNHIHLVSLEGRYQNGAFQFGNNPNTTFVSLHQWDFYCEGEAKTFEGLLQGLNKDEDGAEYPTAWRLPQDRLKVANNTAEKALRAGWVPLRHRYREGSRSVSWYHGPLVPREPDSRALADVWGNGQDTLQVRHADQLLLHDTDSGLLDASYSAAWELGRLLTLQNTKVALQLLHWKREHAHELHAVRHLADYGYHLPVSSKVSQGEIDANREAAIWRWLDELTALQHIPFNYLVPDPDLLSNESIHFFTVDRRWVQCLRDGAFSIGRVLAKDVEQDNQLSTLNPRADKLPAESGFLLRSELVSGWPHLQVTAFKKREAPDAKGSLPDPQSDDVIAPMRTERLAPDVLFVLYAGDAKAVDFFLPPETLHFGLDVPGSNISSDEPDKLIKRRRDPSTGKESSQTFALDRALHFIDFDKRILRFGALASSLMGDNSGHAATLALQLIAGTSLVRFIRPTS